MKNLGTALGALSLIGVIVLFGMHFSGTKSSSSSNESKTQASFASTGKIAYVNIDTLQANYKYLTEEREKFTKSQQAMEAELKRSEQQFQADYETFQRKSQAGTLTQAEGEAAQKRLMQMSSSLKARREALEGQLAKQMDDFNKHLQQQLDDFLADYNKDKKYDYILSYAKGGSIMFANKALDITQDVINGMNALPRPAADAEKKNK